MNAATVVLVSTSFLVAGMLAFAPAPVTLAATANAIAAGDPVNKACPMSGNTLEEVAATREFKGQTIGFCCPGCGKTWDKKTDDKRIALLTTHAPEAVAVIEAAGNGVAQPVAASAQPEAAAEESVAAAIAAATVKAEPVNKICPIMESEVDKDAPTRQFKGVTIGFCCPGCDRKWDRQSDEKKIAMLVKFAPEAITAIAAAAKAAPKPDATSAQPDAAALASNPAVKVARAYMAACGKADAAALNALFLDKGRATVTENASDEGTWETYRDHHLIPELKEMPGFAMTIAQEDVQTFGATSIVRQIGSFTVPDPNHKEQTKNYFAAVTYIVVDDGGAPKIAHLHWSSRAEKKPDAAAFGTGHGTSTGHEHK